MPQLTPPRFQRALIHDVQRHGAGLSEFILEGGEPLIYQPGQWLCFRVGEGSSDDKGTWRVYSFCSAAGEHVPTALPRRLSGRGSGLPARVVARAGRQGSRRLERRFEAHREVRRD